MQFVIHHADVIFTVATFLVVVNHSKPQWCCCDCQATTTTDNKATRSSIVFWNCPRLESPIGQCHSAAW